MKAIGFRHESALPVGRSALEKERAETLLTQRPALTETRPEKEVTMTADASQYPDSGAKIKTGQKVNGLALSAGFLASAGRVVDARSRRVARAGILRIIEAVSHETGISVANIVGHRRFVDVVLARDLAAYEAHLAGFSSVDIGLAMNRDHSSILLAIGREKARRAQ